MYERFAVITGMPRSGTSWVGQIVDSAPEVRYRMSPMFSYEFKNHIREGATRQQWLDLLEGSYHSSNEFMNQTERRRTGEYPSFARKVPDPALLVFKFTRFQNLLEDMLDLLPEVRVVAIVRHPCGAIHSWLTAAKEFPPDADPLEHWRSGSVKKTGYGDFFGFDDWKLVTHLHERLAKERPEQFRLERYEHIVSDAHAGADRIFDFFGLQVGEQTRQFIAQSQERAVAGDYSVFKRPTVAERWRDELTPEIRDAILADLDGTDLEHYIQ